MAEKRHPSQLFPDGMKLLDSIKPTEEQLEEDRQERERRLADLYGENRGEAYSQDGSDALDPYRRQMFEQVRFENEREQKRLKALRDMGFLKD